MSKTAPCRDMHNTRAKSRVRGRPRARARKGSQAMIYLDPKLSLHSTGRYNNYTQQNGTE